MKVTEISKTHSFVQEQNIKNLSIILLVQMLCKILQKLCRPRYHRFYIKLGIKDLKIAKKLNNVRYLREKKSQKYIFGQNLLFTLFSTI